MIAPSSDVAAGADPHLLLAFEGDRPPRSVLDRIATRHAAGVTLFAPNVTTVPAIRALTDELQAARPEGAPPLLIAADQEGGQFLGLGPDTTPFAGNMALGAVDDTDLAERVGAAMGREARALGVNVDYAPNCDLATEPAAAAVGIRSFGDDPQAAGRLAAALVRGLRSAGVGAAPKHFPGTGALPVDTHDELGAVTASRALLDRRELTPFRAAIAADPGLVMTGHVAVPALTGRLDVPATLSRAVVTELLRRDLGYEGVVVTDALDMGALAQGAGRLVDAVAALRAGVDLLLCTPDEAANERLAAGLELAVSRGLVDRAALDVSAARIARLRRRLVTSPTPDLAVVGCREHLQLADELAQRSITLVRDGGELPLRADEAPRVLVLEPRPRDVTPADTTSRVTPTLADALRAHLSAVEELVYDDPPSDVDVAGVLRRVDAADVVVLGTSNAHMVPAQLRLAEAVLAGGTPTVHVILRSPHDLAALPDARTALCTYGSHPPTTAALAAVLVGAAPASGQLPVAVDGQAPRGHGLATRD